MKKLMLGISALMLSALSFNTFAATQSPESNEGKKECTEQTCKKKSECKKEECKKSDCKKSDCKKSECKKGDFKKGNKGGKDFAGRNGKKGQRYGKGKGRENMQAALFDGITLSAEQQQELQALRVKAKDNAKKEKAEFAAKMKEKREKAREDYNKDVKKILSAEQYAKYEANQKALQAKRAEKKAAMQAKKTEKKAAMQAKKAEKRVKNEAEKL